MIKLDYAVCHTKSNTYEDAPVLQSSVSDDETIKLSAEVEFVDSKPSPKSLETDEFITAKKPKSFDPDGSIPAQRRVQSLLVKLQSLQEIKSDLDHMLSETKDSNGEHKKVRRQPKRQSKLPKEALGHGKGSYKEIAHDGDFAVALERLMKKEKILEIDQDVKVILSSLRELVQIQTSAINKKLCSENSSINPLHSKDAFIRFITTKKTDPSVDDSKSACSDTKLDVARMGEKVNGHHVTYTARTEISFTTLKNGEL